MKYNIVATLGENIESIFAAIREFPTERLYLISGGSQLDRIDEIKTVTNRLGIDVQVIENIGNLLEGMFRAFAYIKAVADENSILVNVASGDNLSNCAALSAAFVNGLKAFTVMDNRIVFLPVLKFSYYRLLSEKKLEILKFLFTQPDCCSSLEDLSERTGMSLPLVSYHINGNAEVDGLITLGLVETQVETRGKVKVTLTGLGRLVVEGVVELAKKVKV